MMNPGNFRHHVDIVAPGGQRDSAGQVVGNDTVKLRGVPCSIETVTGGEVRRGQQMQATTNKLVRMWFIEGEKAPTAKDKLVERHGEKVVQEINILAAYDPDGRRRELLVQGRSNG
jgi:hypothetical protein